MIVCSLSRGSHRIWYPPYEVIPIFSCLYLATCSASLWGSARARQRQCSNRSCVGERNKALVGVIPKQIGLSICSPPQFASVHMGAWGQITCYNVMMCNILIIQSVSSFQSQWCKVFEGPNSWRCRHGTSFIKNLSTKTLTLRLWNYLKRLFLSGPNTYHPTSTEDILCCLLDIQGKHYRSGRACLESITHTSTSSERPFSKLSSA